MPPPRPAALDKPSQGMAAGINLSYALQWWLGAIAGYAFVLLRARREHLDALDAQSELDAADGGAPGGESARADEVAAAGEASDRVPATSTRPSRPPRAKRPRKQRIWDEEDA